MKTFFRLTIAALTVLGISTSAQAAKKKPADLSDFRGNYAGTISFVLSGTVYTGTASVAVTVPKNGRSATITASGALVLGGMLPFSDTFTLARSGAYGNANILLGLEGPGTPEVGTYVARQRVISYQAAFSTGMSSGTTSGKITIRRSGKKQKLTFTNILVPTGQNPTSFTLEVSRKLKKSEK